MEFPQINGSRKIMFILVLFFLGLMSISVTHAETYTFITKWGSSGNGNGQFKYPEGIAVDSSSNVYVIDSLNNLVQKFDSNGKFITKWGSYGKGTGQFAWPTDVAVDSRGNVYVCDSENNRIQKFDSNGSFIISWGSFGYSTGQFDVPEGVAVDSMDNIYVADSGNEQIQKFDSNGNFINKWGFSENSSEQTFSPQGIAVDFSGKVYVSDTQNNWIQEFDSNGNYLKQWGSSGTEIGQFDYPSDVAVDSSGNVYVVDNNNSRIEKFDSNGSFISTWGSFGSGNGQFRFPVGVAVDASGNVYVSDLGNRRIQKFAIVEKINPTIIWNNPAEITYGTALSGTQLNAVASYNGNIVYGSFLYTPPAGTVLSVGSNILHVDFTPKDAAKYNKVTRNVTIFVKPAPPKPIADFTATPTTGNAPLNVAFNDTSTGSPTSWSWNFGDKTPNSALKNPIHTYAKAGKYTVSLTVTNAAGRNTTTRLNYIIVTVPLKPVAAFSASPLSGKAPLTVTFTDMSTGSPTSWKWSFGDGTSSTARNPVHKYAKKGKYTISLTVKNSATSSTKMISNYITVK